MASPDTKKKSSDSIYQSGISPQMDAWFISFLIENHLDYYTFPDHATSQEQIRFMVFLKDDERYYPCSDKMFKAIIDRKQSAFLQKKYNEVLQKILDLIERKIEDEWEKEYLESLIITKYKHETKDEILIPSRLEKRLFKIFMNRTRIEDPFYDEKFLRNQRAKNALNSKAFTEAINYVEKSYLENPPETLAEIKHLIEHIELKRLISISVEKQLWESETAEKMTKENYLDIFDRKISGNGVKQLFNFLGRPFGSAPGQAFKAKKILWLVEESGEIMVDLAIIRLLAKLGHKIIIAFKEGPRYTKVDFLGIEDDMNLKEDMKNTAFIMNPDMSKNDLLKKFRQDNNIFSISDGTSEELNLILTSTTFARVFKEVDGIISRGLSQRRRFIDTHFHFTQDIYNIAPDEDGIPCVSFKPRHPEVIKFSQEDLENKASAIIDQMTEAQSNGNTVVFYSGIIGSIPGKIETAKKIMSVFIKHLKQQFAMTFIINPSEYYEQGMDADDLMYMWEIVQKSGLINIWRFQSYDDIAQAFKIMNKKVPPEWVGKDATFSTGCTKEMKIALEVQKQYPEMQLIGPPIEKFMRREEYGIGKMYDTRLCFETSL